MEALSRGNRKSRKERPPGRLTAPYTPSTRTLFHGILSAYNPFNFRSFLRNPVGGKPVRTYLKRSVSHGFLMTKRVASYRAVPCASLPSDAAVPLAMPVSPATMG